MTNCRLVATPSDTAKFRKRRNSASPGTTALGLIAQLALISTHLMSTFDHADAFVRNGIGSASERSQAIKTVPSMVAVPLPVTFSDANSSTPRAKSMAIGGQDANGAQNSAAKKDTGQSYVKIDHSRLTQALTNVIKGGPSHLKDQADVLLGIIFDADRNDESLDITTYNAALACLASAASPSNIKVAETILKSLEDHPEISPDVFTYTSVICCLASSTDRGRKGRSGSVSSVDAPARAMAILEQLEQLYQKTSDPSICPNVQTYSAVMNCYANSRTVEGAKKAGELLHLMEETSTMKGREEVTPNHVAYATCINAMANAGMAGQAMEILDRMLQKEMREGSVRPNAHCFASVMKAYVKSKKMRLGESASRCEELMERMLALYRETGDEDVRPNVFIYNTLLDAYAKEVRIASTHEQRRRWANKAVSLLGRMEEGIDGVQPDRFSFCSVINALAKCGDAKSASDAENVLEGMEERGGDTPDTATCNAVLSAWANVGTIEGAERAEALLERIDYPDAISYNTIVSAWTKCRGRSKNERRKAVERAEAYLVKMEEVDLDFANVITYSSIIDCWAKSGAHEAISRVESLLARMEERAIEVNVITLNSAMEAYSQNGTVHSALKAEELLRRKEDMASSIIYFAVINTWSRTGAKEAGERAEAILRRMEDRFRAGDRNVRPSKRVYHRCITAHANSKFKSGILGADNLLKSMEQGKALAKPNVFCYNAIVHAYAKRGNAQASEAVLRRMDEYSQTVVNRDDIVYPDERTFNSIIYALSVCREKDKAARAQQVLNRMENSLIEGDWEVAPSTFSYNLVINACACTYGNLEKRAAALEIANDAFSRLCASNHCNPNRFTYVSILKACGKLLPPKSAKRRRLAQRYFQQCCAEGLVDDNVVKNMNLAAPGILSASR